MPRKVVENFIPKCLHADAGFTSPEDIQRFLQHMAGQGNIVIQGMDRFDIDDGNDGDTSGVQGPAAGESLSSVSRLDSLRTFDMKPKEVVSYLDRFVIQQRDAKKVLAVAICDHYNHCRRLLSGSDLSGSDSNSCTEYAKPNILLTGPTGVGKTYLMRTLARLIGVPFVKADATKFSETGVVGQDVEDLVRDLVDAAGGNISVAQFGIVYVDEVDKIASGGGGEGRLRGDFNTRGVQNNFLKLLEDTEVSLERNGGMRLLGGMGGMGGTGSGTINTRNILFIFSGAFTQLDADIRRKKQKRASLGFTLDTPPAVKPPAVKMNGKVSASDLASRSGAASGYGAAPSATSGADSRPTSESSGCSSSEEVRSFLRYAETSDFLSAGLEAEFIGRLPVRVALDSLSSEDLKQILCRAEGSVLKQFVRNFNAYGIQMQVTDESLTQIARLAVMEGTGARGLVTILERTLREHKYELPSSAISSFELDNATVMSPRDGLEALLRSQTADEVAAVLLADIKRWERHLSVQVAPLQAWLTDEAIDFLLNMAHASGEGAFALAARRFEKLPAALKQIAETTGQKQLPISLALAKDPEKELSKWMQLIDK
eukprot:CAMPEP_0119306314 /NCGR_PEP_ID=MMETSP1333-20130426/7093_1 /TAXON_ID=418940 /ORGANISM="Scyphosphaera apsteinii, Strain RCC1455" /LENGTH=599 /DNA_ID=CAMNT_0007309581 /DNA_START=59 /DNA_END=1858 /DNA_ORIENTATION=+